MSTLDEHELERALAQIQPVKVSALFFRTIAFKYANAADSVRGAIERGGRFNPPQKLARDLCGIPDGFGYLYTATSPLACFFECGHVLRGLSDGEFQYLVVEPTLMVSFKVEADYVLDLRARPIQELLRLSTSILCSQDHRAVLNTRGELTPLQTLGTAVYKSGRFSGILTPSRFTDVFPSSCFDFLPQQVRCELQGAGEFVKPAPL